MKALLKVVCISSLTIMGCVIVEDVGEIWDQGAADIRLSGEWIIRKSALKIPGAKVSVSPTDTEAGLSVVGYNKQNGLVSTDLWRTFSVSNCCFVVIKAPELDAQIKKAFGKDIISVLMRYDVANSETVVFSTLNSNGWERVVSCGIKARPILEEIPPPPPSSGRLKIIRITMSDLSVLANLDSTCWSEYEVWDEFKVEAEP